MQDDSELRIQFKKQMEELSGGDFIENESTWMVRIGMDFYEVRDPVVRKRWENGETIFLAESTEVPPRRCSR